MTGDESEGWVPTLRDLESRRAAGRSMGGAERLARHHDAGKLDARARIEQLLDDGSFHEIGTLVGTDVAADAFVAGAGTIDARPVMIGAEDFTSAGGTIGSGSNAKRYRIAELALKQKMPLVMLLEGAGYRPETQPRARTPVDLIMQARCSGQIPIVTAVLGSSAGHGALVAPMSDFSVMTEQAAIFTAGPPVVRQSTGEDVTKADLGGPEVALASGLVHNLAADDRSALALIRRYLSYFPSSAWSYPEREAASEVTADRATPALADIVPREGRRTYDMRRVVTEISDRDDWLEVGSGRGGALICGLTRIGGHAVALVANQPLVQAGAIDAAAADKAAHFIAVADAFHLPLVFLCDNPGMLPGARSEQAGVLRSGARMFAAQTRATTPKIHLMLRKGYGFGSMVMAMASFDNQVATFAYPGATLGAMGADASAAATRGSAEDAVALHAAELAASYRAAENLGFDELIDPAETRSAIRAALDRAMSSRQQAAEPVAHSGITP